MTTPLDALRLDDPYPYYARRAAEQPFAFDPTLDMWVAADARAVHDVLRAPELAVRPPGNSVPGPIRDTAAGSVYKDLIRMRDDAARDELKDAVVTTLSRVTATEVARVAGELARDAVRRGPDYRELAFGVPAATVATLCGVPAAEVGRAAEVTAEFVRCIPGSATAEDCAAAAAAADELRPLIATAAAKGDGLVASLMAATGASGATESEVVSNGIGFLSQTYDATAGLVGNALRARTTYDLGPSAHAFVAEVARHDAPIQNTRRFATEPYRYGPHTVRAGQVVLVLLAAANRDPMVNEDPDEFRPDRSDPVTFTFSAGAHECPGRALAIGIAAEILSVLDEAGWSPGDLHGPVRYMPSPNARIPVFGREER
ncbi:cytochrome P450 [Haloechinothrix halophila]|uniref:cytochrome P450 n=1 Tax=Haloechinothrix halophila TaxID=1069073 RepID=UPI0004191418|nr:cytochrome P450 [Haloechinothrix halophila]